MRPHPLGLVAIVVAFTMTACSPAYDAETRDGLREHVVTVSEASAAGDWQAAIDELDVMTAELATAREDGRVDDDRFEAIVGAMELVRLDLEAAIAAAADEAERQRLIEEQARLQQQIEELQDQGDDKGEKGKGDKGDKEKDDDR
ncbi:hypothetical protein [Agromyces mariniharenae]|uniref:Uncharacterized protein n=1 Tax=Agromyces mariniharenae TaxID=2604423 RepID=A0A5S4VJB4_9MICO|nr:hypothetical protein [Agromyces mariniharenae]TYL54225.1 hypothetical protein FYC51_11685 [Agromyces mariniharenae]